jgi:hypothetical protein
MKLYQYNLFQLLVTLSIRTYVMVFIVVRLICHMSGPDDYLIGKSL